MPTTTLIELQRDVLDRLDNNSGFYPGGQITLAINEFVRIVNAFTGMNQATLPVGTGVTVPNQSLYAAPAGLLFPMDVNYDGRTLDKLSLFALTRNHLNWATTSTVKAGPVTRWAPIGLRMFVMHPIDAVGGRTLEMMGVIEPVPLETPTDVIPLEDPFLSMAVEYCCARVRLKEGGPNFAQCSLQIQTFWRVLKDRNILQLNKMPKYFLMKGVTT